MDWGILALFEIFSEFVFGRHVLEIVPFLDFGVAHYLEDSMELVLMVRAGGFNIFFTTEKDGLLGK